MCLSDPSDRASSSPDALPPPSVLRHIVDVHCHPTDTITSSEVISELPIRICAMATRQSDQRLVADLATAHPDKVTPCFGYHPWFTHWISLEPAPSKRAHYASLFLDASPKTEHLAAFERLLPELPEPMPLASALTELRANLTAFPSAMLGEVGVDRACRIPFVPPADPPYPAGPDGDGMARELSPFTTPLAHQLSVLEAQLAVAVELRRNVSVHSVKCQQATVELLRRMRARHGDAWVHVSVDMHSCGLSAQTWADIQKEHPNVFLSLSTAINGRSPAHRALISACASHRILVESDFHDVRHSTAYTVRMLRTVAEVKGWTVEDAWNDGLDGVGDEDRWGAVRRLEANWRRFEKGGHQPNRKKPRRKLLLEDWESDEEDRVP
ncbi:hypothetical protein SCP_0103130 [Sparassis crispa]|uniref:Cut9-interacting protein n=1 Tax=Sparassis crispa TaxID=139825 RepID=A0A401G5J8_9APHY|nr:hypothetical protein SCP_0103130 [Sparassis crispa]GBE77438.1 hypothetical protein SCP_0103130 [Sparassis crispa]